MKRFATAVMLTALFTVSGCEGPEPAELDYTVTLTMKCHSSVKLEASEKCPVDGNTVTVIGACRAEGAGKEMEAISEEETTDSSGEVEFSTKEHKICKATFTFAIDLKESETWEVAPGSNIPLSLGDSADVEHTVYLRRRAVSGGNPTDLSCSLDALVKDTSGNALDNATVKGYGSTSCVTDSTGSCSLAGQPCDVAQNFTVSKPGFQDLTKSATLTKGAANPLTFELTPDASKGTLDAICKEPDGSAISGCLVKESGSNLSCTTDGTGSCSLSGLSLNQALSFTAEKSGYSSDAWATTLTTSTPVSHGFVLTKQAGSATFSFTVKDQSGVALDNVLVEEAGGTHKCTTNSSGSCSVSGVPDGSYSFAASKTGYKVSAVYAVTVNGGGNFSHTFTLEKGTGSGSLDATVVDSSTSAPLAGCVVKETGSGLSCTTNSSGTCTVVGLALNTSLSFDAMCSTYSSASWSTTLTSSTPASHTFSLTKGGSVSPTGNMVVEVTAEGSLTLLGNASVVVKCYDATTSSYSYNKTHTTVAGSKLVIKDLAPCVYSVEASASGYLPKSGKVKIEPYLSKQVAFALKPSSAASCTPNTLVKIDGFSLPLSYTADFGTGKMFWYCNSSGVEVAISDSEVALSLTSGYGSVSGKIFTPSAVGPAVVTWTWTNAPSSITTKSSPVSIQVTK